MARSGVSNRGVLRGGKVETCHASRVRRLGRVGFLGMAVGVLLAASANVAFAQTCGPPDGDVVCPLPACTTVRRFSAPQVKLIQTYDTRTRTPVALPAGSGKAAELQPLRAAAANALNRASQELQSRGLGEHLGILNGMNVYLSVDKVGDGKAFVSPPSDLVINAGAFAGLWEGYKVGAMLHEVHHFTRHNQDLYGLQRDYGLPMGTGTPYENDAFRFQRSLGFPADGDPGLRQAEGGGR